jgi:hypothetical protein
LSSPFPTSFSSSPPFVPFSPWFLSSSFILGHLKEARDIPRTTGNCLYYIKKKADCMLLKASRRVHSQLNLWCSLQKHSTWRFLHFTWPQPWFQVQPEYVNPPPPHWTCYLTSSRHTLEATVPEEGAALALPCLINIWLMCLRLLTYFRCFVLGNHSCLYSATRRG